MEGIQEFSKRSLPRGVFMGTEVPSGVKGKAPICRGLDWRMKSPVAEAKCGNSIQFVSLQV